MDDVTISLATLRAWRIALEHSFYVPEWSEGQGEVSDADDVHEVLAGIEQVEQDAYRQEARDAFKPMSRIARAR